ncbi:TraM recognition domain-containing protein [Catellatospora sp. NPDC049133]|uniref:type IV secretory system conjugative DNA transfer family protein n=1 Tax=Catellatospora sp. NPDC049133 TaxID=3155499 RepID=UPI0033C9CF0B
MKAHRTVGGGGDEIGMVLGAVAVAVLVPALIVWVPIQTVDPPGHRGGGPVRVVVDLIAGRISWDWGCTAVLLAELVVLALLALLGVWLWRSGRKNHSRVDWAARHMASADDLAKLTPQGVEESARRLRPAMGETQDADQFGIPIGVTVPAGIELRQTWEDMACDIWGPRTGKTTSRAIPAIVAAPGPVVATSVKGDIVDATIEPRAKRGKVWVFDPMYLLSRDLSKPGVPSFWWNPLRGIDTITKARLLAEHFSFAEQANDGASPRDPFFDTKASDFIANLMLAAAVSGAHDMTDVYRWTTNQRDTTPGDILKDRNYHLPAESVYGVLAMPDRTRGSVYAIAEAALAVLTEPAVTAWITPPPDGRPELDITAFVRSTDTLYMLSRGGPGTPAPLIAALADAVLRAGEAAARPSPGRRLDPPLFSCLDEAANIVRIRQLPSLYSFYGSHGLPIMTILQSWAQGEEVWGKAGMRKLWDSSNVRTYGGGVADPAFLEEISRNIGHYWMTTKSVTTQSRGWDRSVNRSPQRMRVLDVEDLFAMPVGRMVVLPSGAPAALVRTRPWQVGPYADGVRASLAKWDPQGQAYDPKLLPEDTVLHMEGQ